LVNPIAERESLRNKVLAIGGLRLERGNSKPSALGVFSSTDAAQIARLSTKRFIRPDATCAP
jgi:hypothetical protein